MNLASSINQHCLAVGKDYESGIALTYVEEVNGQSSARLADTRADNCDNCQGHPKCAEERRGDAVAGRRGRVTTGDSSWCSANFRRAIDRGHPIDWLPPFYQHGQHTQRYEIQSVDDRMPAFVVRHAKG